MADTHAAVDDQTDYQFPVCKCKMTEKRQTSQGYIIRILQHGGFENYTCLKKGEGATKKYYICRVSPQSPCTINNERSLILML
jgi:hypothetical protein